MAGVSPALAAKRPNEGRAFGVGQARRPLYVFGSWGGLVGLPIADLPIADLPISR